MLPYFRFQLHRRWRKLKKANRTYRVRLVNYFYRHIWGKWRQLGIIRRFSAVWWGLVVIALVAVSNQNKALETFYIGKSPLPGGIYTEGVVGEVKTINPVLPTNSASVDASRLVFSGLTRLAPSGKLEPELAESWRVSDDGLTHVFRLRKGIKWHDGVAFTANDVVFTLAAIQHPDSRSPLAGEWKGVTAKAEGDHKVVFTLPNPYVGFTYLTTVGILPRHLLESINPSTLRIVSFNQQPVGTGPFKVKSFVADEKAVLEANSDYFRGRPLLDGFTLRFFKSDGAAMEAFAKRQVNAIAKVGTAQREAADKLEDLRLLRYHTTEQTNLFFKTSASTLGDRNVRRALVLATDKKAVVADALDNLARPLGSPILPGQLGYNARYNQPPKNIPAAARLLDDAGWKLVDGKRQKGQAPLKLTLVTLDNSQLREVAEQIKKQWGELGVDVIVRAVGLDELIQSHIKPRQYDVLLFGITVGSDPDVYPYWHSSQVNDPGLNLSQYKSPAADAALEVGRITVDPEVRAGKYDVFLRVFRQDAPAVILYGEDYLYGVNGNVLGQEPGVLAQPADRFYGVEKWTVRTRPTILN